MGPTQPSQFAETESMSHRRNFMAHRFTYVNAATGSGWHDTLACGAAGVPSFPWSREWFVRSPTPRSGLALHGRMQQAVPMEYRGVEYAVVQTISKEWRWSVARDSGNDKVGFCTNREAALARAKGVIDRIVRGRNSIDEIVAPDEKVR